MKYCPTCGDVVTDRFQFLYAGQTFCTKTCAEIYCDNHIEHQCSFCSQPLCNADPDEIKTSGNQIFCCIEHMHKYAKAAREANAYDNANDR